MDTALSSLLTNKRRVSALKTLGVVTVGDALTYYPFRVTEPVPQRAIREAAPGQTMACAVMVRSLRVVPMNTRRGYRLEALVDDSDFARTRHVGGSVARLTFFSYRKSYVDWLGMRLRAGESVVIAGTPTEYMGQAQFTHPEILTVAPPTTPAAFDAGAMPPAGDGIPTSTAGDAFSAPLPPASPSALQYDAATVAEAMRRLTRPRPVYHASSRISSEHIHETILGLLRMLAESGDAANAAAAGLDTVDAADSRGGVESAGSIESGGVDGAADPAGANGFADPSETQPGISPDRLAAAVPDILPDAIRVERGLLHRAEAFLAIHNPDSTKAFRAGIDTLRYEEAFVAQTSLLQARAHARKSAAHPCPLAPGGAAAPQSAQSPSKVIAMDSAADDYADDRANGTSSSQSHAARKATDTEVPLRDRFIASLPFTLTGGQRQVIDDIAEDMAHDWPMQRLLQGEVGSGKTVVALAAMLQAVGAGYQAVLVAPTQVLAEQHADSITRMVDGLGVPVTLLTGGMKLAARRKALAQAASGEPCIVVATHAAFSKTFQAPNLALVVIDEQHRFGVEQRESLNAKADLAPHLLVMTATPIPRTAAMTWFGDLDISWLTELPGGRKPIRTVVVNEADANTMGRMFAHIRARLDAGERAYIVCARIDDNGEDDDPGAIGADSATGGTRAQRQAFAEIDPYDVPDAQAEDTPVRPPLHTVAEIADRLSKLPQFQGIAFATLTGRDKDETKTQVMSQFAGGETPVLVATTVIEVGVDVKQASCIVIFDADRYGLSQLHQLRGRVGRGGTPSWAFLISRAEAGSPAEQRLEVVHGTLDGAEIAQADLEFRGAGDVLGDAQSGGKSGLKLLRVVKDVDLITDARARAERLLAEDPELAGEVQLAGAVLDFTRGNETFLTSS
ncbi:ATP-dependent DNA helicase RecG [Bifidobacterium eulemuris]|uniref:ATP-dependent DNA helicase RecG n=1 Tax=Bifidobacterium eulemuris TaxID=1765219 RepID=A0A7L9SS32_9BIFI|nr:ATP-dependent DNA helicase RecG [Bifidobacterium eulemuris]